MLYIRSNWFFFLSALLLFSSCDRLYSYRKKVPVSSGVTKHVHFTLVNKSPSNISPAFESGMKTYCAQRLAKQGFIETTKEKYDYDVVITLRVDSFPIVKGVWLGPAGQGIQQESHVKQISADYEIMYPNTRFTYWKSRSAIYFFGYQKRDLRRSKSVARYTLRHVY